MNDKFFELIPKKRRRYEETYQAQIENLLEINDHLFCFVEQLKIVKEMF